MLQDIASPQGRRHQMSSHTNGGPTTQFSSSCFSYRNTSSNGITTFDRRHRNVECDDDMILFTNSIDQISEALKQIAVHKELEASPAKGRRTSVRAVSPAALAEMNAKLKAVLQSLPSIKEPETAKQMLLSLLLALQDECRTLNPDLEFTLASSQAKQRTAKAQTWSFEKDRGLGRTIPKAQTARVSPILGADAVIAERLAKKEEARVKKMIVDFETQLEQQRTQIVTLFEARDELTLENQELRITIDGLKKREQELQSALGKSQVLSNIQLKEAIQEYKQRAESHEKKIRRRMNIYHTTKESTIRTLNTDLFNYQNLLKHIKTCEHNLKAELTARNGELHNARMTIANLETELREVKAQVQQQDTRFKAQRKRYMECMSMLQNQLQECKATGVKVTKEIQREMQFRKQAFRTHYMLLGKRLRKCLHLIRLQQNPEVDVQEIQTDNIIVEPQSVVPNILHRSQIAIASSAVIQEQYAQTVDTPLAIFRAELTRQPVPLDKLPDSPSASVSPLLEHHRDSLLMEKQRLQGGLREIQELVLALVQMKEQVLLVAHEAQEMRETARSSLEQVATEVRHKLRLSYSTLQQATVSETHLVHGDAIKTEGIPPPASQQLARLAQLAQLEAELNAAKTANATMQEEVLSIRRALTQDLPVAQAGEDLANAPLSELLRAVIAMKQQTQENPNDNGAAEVALGKLRVYCQELHKKHNEVTIERDNLRRTVEDLSCQIQELRFPPS